MSHVPWVEKYRPKNVGEVACQEEVVATLTRSIESANLPHLLFYGPPGTGKTSTALAIARQLYGPELFKQRVMELNASDERGIGVVRNKIKSFAAIAVGAGVPGYPCPPYKIIILDEADSMTEDAQNALRRTMELHSRITRFCFICNYVSRIIEPITSRCAKFRFKPLGADAMWGRLQDIANSEGLTLASGALTTLETIAGGDMRKAITLMQSSSRLYGKEITSQALEDVAGKVPDEAVAALVAAVKAANFDRASTAVADLVKDGYPALQLLLQFSDALLSDDSMADEAKACVATRLAEADKALADGADESLQLLDCASVAIRAVAGLPPVGPAAAAAL